MSEDEGLVERVEAAMDAPLRRWLSRMPASVEPQGADFLNMADAVHAAAFGAIAAVRAWDAEQGLVTVRAAPVYTLVTDADLEVGKLYEDHRGLKRRITAIGSGGMWRDIQYTVVDRKPGQRATGRASAFYFLEWVNAKKSATPAPQSDGEA